VRDSTFAGVTGLMDTVMEWSLDDGTPILSGIAESMPHLTQLNYVCTSKESDLTPLTRLCHLKHLSLKHAMDIRIHSGVCSSLDTLRLIQSPADSLTHILCHVAFHTVRVVYIEDHFDSSITDWKQICEHLSMVQSLVLHNVTHVKSLLTLLKTEPSILPALTSVAFSFVLGGFVPQRFYFWPAVGDIVDFLCARRAVSVDFFLAQGDDVVNEMLPQVRTHFERVETTFPTRVTFQRTPSLF
jgi:hypothetical protein